MFHRVPLIISLIFFILILFWAGFTLNSETSEKSIESSPDAVLAADQKTVKITFVGDIMLAREVEKSIIANGVDYPFATIKTEWAESDLVIGNFEDTIRPNYRYEGEILAFDSTPANIIGLKNAGFTHLSLANNHGDDWGAAITASTRATLETLGLTPFGDPLESQLHIAHVEKNGLKIALIGFHAFLEEPATIATAITAEKAAGNFVIVMPHWGNEYQVEPSPAQVDAAQIFTAAGADLIVGGHPHIIEPINTVNGVPVAYSLGNFIFDQDWSIATTQGLMLQVTITDSAITITPVAISIKNRQASLGTFSVPAAQTWLRQ